MFKLEMSKVATPLEADLKLTKEMSLQIENVKVDMQKVPNQSVVGRLMYCMTCTKFAYLVKVVSRFLIDLGETH
jgi:hypothetical protein